MPDLQGGLASSKKNLDSPPIFVFFPPFNFLKFDVSNKEFLEYLTCSKII
jgi:hypothetical protein